MSCCVSGCKNKRSSSKSLNFFRIPRGPRGFQRIRARLWLSAIQQVNGGAYVIRGNALVCGAHFVSGEASMDRKDPDFVPSVFPCPPHNNVPKKKPTKRVFGRRKRRHKANLKKEEQTTPSQDDSPVSSILMEEMQAPSSPLQEAETATNGAESEPETKTNKSKTSSSHKNGSPSSMALAVTPTLGTRFPTLLLKSVFTPENGYQCGLCDQTFAIASQLVKHTPVHEERRQLVCEVCGIIFWNETDLTEHQHVEEPAFPCNMCDRSFTTSQNLKRHKLLHVKDGRKCPKCGAIFCQLHNHVLFLPQPESELEEPESKGSSDSDDCDDDDCDDDDDDEVEHNNGDDRDTQSSLQAATVQTASPATPRPQPAPVTRNPLPPKAHTRIISEIPIPGLIRPFPLPRQLPLLAPKYCPASVVQPRLPPSLEMFSVQYLTSALLEVKRDYEYILSKETEKASDAQKQKTTVKEEPRELPLTPPTPPTPPPVEQIAKRVKDKNVRIAYDLEVVL